MKRFWIFILIAGTAIVAMSAFQFLSRPGKGDVAPAFELKTLDGRQVSLSQFKGRPVIIHFWASWCGTCAHELPALGRIYEVMKAKGIALIAISEDDVRDATRVKSLLQSAGASFDVPIDTDGKVADSYASYAVPETFLVDPNGKIVARRAGEIDWENAKTMEWIEKQIMGAK